MFKFIIIENILLLLFLFILFLTRRKILRKKEKNRYNSLYPGIINYKAKFVNFKNENCDFDFKTIFELHNVGFYQFKLKKINSHKHMKVSSLLYIINGKADGIIGSKKIHAKPGDFIFVPKGIPHHWEMKKPLEYLELSIPSLTSTNLSDVVWL